VPERERSRKTAMSDPAGLAETAAPSATAASPAARKAAAAAT
jgi:hypothetical protein